MNPLGNIDPELLRAILQGGEESGQIDPEVEALKQKAEMIRGLQPDMGMQGYGPMRVAPGWGKVAAMGLGGYMQAKGMQGTTQLQKQQGLIRSGQNNRVLDALMKMQQGFGQAPAGVQSPADNDPAGYFRMGGGA